ncbi:MAG: energy-coupling factor ABC transporter substrate-binding protein [Atribacterota bacterium]
MFAKRNGMVLGLTLFVVLVMLFVISIVVDFGLEGADDRASSAVGELNPEYRPWVQNFFEPSERGEKALFVLQILIGIGLGGYSLWRLKRGKSAH